jgi:hypothetical protein
MNANPEIDAKDWLHDLLVAGPLPPKQVKELARQQGIPWWQVKQAKKPLFCFTHRCQCQCACDRDDYLWSLPTTDEETLKCRYCRAERHVGVRELNNDTTAPKPQSPPAKFGFVRRT